MSALEEKDTHALVVGIDKYDFEAIPPLTGAVNDALAAVTWLQAIGVPAANIFLHAKRAAPLAGDLKPAGIALTESATADDIWGSIRELRKRATGSGRLFVFLSGHGFYEPSSERLFLAQDFADDDVRKNLSLRDYQRFFRSLGYPQQFLFMDACSTLPYASSVRQQIQPGLPGLDDPARADTGLIACYSAGQGQRANEDPNTKHGLFMQALLAALQPANLASAAVPPVAVDLDWRTGTRSLDLYKVIAQYVATTVTKGAAALGEQQIPALPVIDGSPAITSKPILSLTPEVTSTLRIEVEPAEACAAIQQIFLFPVGRMTPLMLPSATDPLAPPLEYVLPRGTRVDGKCSLAGDAPWDVVSAALDVTLIEPRHVKVLEFRAAQLPVQPLPGGTPDSDIEAAAEAQPASVKIDLASADGRPAYEMNGDRYAIAAEAAGVDVPHDGAEVAEGVTFYHHESGPEFRAAPGRVTAAAHLASRWAEGVRTAVGGEFSVTSTVRGWRAPKTVSGVRFILPAGGPESLAGVLAGQPLLTLASAADPAVALRRLSLTAAESDLVETGPGLFTAALELPWGAWSELVEVPLAGEARVELPESVGVPPLRVALRGRARQPGQISALASDTFAGTSGNGLFGRPGLGSAESYFAAVSGRGSVAVAEFMDRDPGAPWYVTIAGDRRISFPLYRDRSFGAARGPAGTRVEPLSAVEAPEWDKLIAAGRLDALTPEEAERLSFGKWEDELLGVAAAYALWSQPHGDFLRGVLGNLGGLVQCADLDLLRLASDFPAYDAAPDVLRERLERPAGRGEVPLFSWGVGLALRLTGGAPLGDDEPLGRWRTALRAIAAGLSPISAWTCWTE
ncbi:MAG: caspase family protein [Chloroflexi bacterium]|nr:caspase family protein [Chloroflexota bacterium]